MSVQGYYPTDWPYKGLVYSGLDTNEDRLPVLIQVLITVIEYWQSKKITGPNMNKLMLEAQTVLAGVEAAYANDKVLTSPYQYVLVAQVVDVLDKLAPEHLYFGESPTHANQHGFWSADTLTTLYFLRA